MSAAGELARLAELLNAGLVTREEFEQLKAKILQA
jgi:multidrug resistance efflux pump